MNQTSLLCGCGGDVTLDAHNGQQTACALCPYCARRARHNQERFSGNREAVLRRDGYQCQLCGALDAGRLVVHHRRPGHNRTKDLITLCRACHVRVHFTARPSFAFVSHQARRQLWRELHRRAPEQRVLPIGETVAGEQAKFFE